VRHSVTASSASSSTDNLAHDVAAAQAMAAADPCEERTRETPLLPFDGPSSTPEPVSPEPAHPSETPHASDVVTTPTSASLDTLVSIYPEFSQTVAPASDVQSSSSNALGLDQAASGLDGLKESPLLGSSPVRQGEDEVLRSWS